ncbi:MAG: hypothetical protein HY721_24670 [Planctomycetes bacterium]|nr:hypothetical protein [Planctomycetota bacterium]
MKQPFTIAIASIAAGLGLAACSSPSGPVAPALVPSPLTKVTFTPDLQGAVGVPNVPTAQVFDHTPDGHLKYQFQLQNNTGDSFFLRVQATFVDEKGVVVDPQQPTRVPFQPGQIQTISVTSANALARDVRVQVMPAR